MKKQVCNANIRQVEEKCQGVGSVGSDETNIEALAKQPIEADRWSWRMTQRGISRLQKVKRRCLGKCRSEIHDYFKVKWSPAIHKRLMLGSGGEFACRLGEDYEC